MISMKFGLNEKKAQIDKIIETFPVMLLIFLLMGIFIFLSVGAKSIKQPSFPEITVNVPGADNLLLREIELFVNKEMKKMFVFDALMLVERGEIGRNDFEKANLDLTKKEEKCVILIKGHTDKKLITGNRYFYTDYDWRFDNGKKFYYDEKTYRERGLLNFLSLTAENKGKDKREDIRLISYYGGCLK